MNEPTPSVKIDDAVARMALAVAKAKGEWTSKVMQSVMPQKLFVRSKFIHKKKSRVMLHHWILENNVREQSHPDRTVILMGDHIIGEFRCAMKDGAMEVVAKVLPLPTEKA